VPGSEHNASDRPAIGQYQMPPFLLDEIGDIALELQPKLPRVLREREFERLRSTQTLRTDARLIAATNRDLEGVVEEQKFRSDLYYRMNVFPVRVCGSRKFGNSSFQRVGFGLL